MPSSGSEFLRPAPPRVLAHRGLAIDAPENSLLAFARALAVGVNHIETDVHASSDGKAVIAHDADLTRVADRNVRIDQLTMPELRRVDLGHGQGFPSLAEALDAFPDARFNIDIKAAGAVQPTVDTILEARAVKRVLVTSFSEARRLAAVSQLPGVATSIAALGTLRLLTAQRLWMRRTTRKLLEGMAAVQLPERYKGLHVLTPRLIRAAHDAGAEVHVWTINAETDMHRLLDLGVDGLVTDRADLALDVIRNRGTTAL